MSTSTQQPEPPTSGPKTTLTVPAKPAAITGANLLALAGTAAVAGGPVGWLAAGAVLGAPVAVVGARRAYRNRKQQRQERRRSVQERRTTSTQGGGRGGLLGGSGRGRSGSGAGGAAGAGRGRRGLLGGGAAGAGGAGTGRRTGLLGRLTRGGGSAGGAGAGGRHAAGRGSGAGTSGRSGSGGTSRRGGGGLLPSWMRRNKDGSGAGSGSTGKKKRGGLSDGTYRKWGPCNGIEDRSGRTTKKSKPDDKNAGGEKPTKPVKPTVDRGPQQRGPGAKPPSTRPAPARPGTPVRLPGQPTRTTAGGDMSAGTRETAGRMWANTAAWEPKGMLDAVEEFHDLPQSLAYVRATVGTLMEKSAGRLPLDSAIAKQIGQIVALLDTAAKMAPKVPEAIEAIHKAELDRLRRPRNGESKWDRAANGLA